ncbi:MAG: hypothetical protein ACK5V3_02170 [Bdellovibrionales bacterium]
MKSSALIPLIIGLFVGSLVTYKFNSPSKPHTADENANSDKSFEGQNESKIIKVPQCQNEDNDDTKKSNNAHVQMTDHSHNLNHLVRNDSQSANLQACYDQLRPSNVDEWQSNWRKRVKDFISTNDAFWDSQGNRNFDVRVIPSIIGNYKGRWSGLYNSQVRADINLAIVTDTEGTIRLSLIDTSNPDEPITSDCLQVLVPRKNLGLDEKESAVNVFLQNCNPQMLGAMYSQFAFKIPMNLQKGQQKSVEVFGLEEEFIWKAAGIFNLQKQ